jgi:hypothetical protein
MGLALALAADTTVAVPVGLGPGVTGVDVLVGGTPTVYVGVDVIDGPPVGVLLAVGVTVAVGAGLMTTTL